MNQIGKDTPVITLWEPWASWVMLGWKTIETRRHRRFAGLAGKRIAIHASTRFDKTAMDAARMYLTPAQCDQTRYFQTTGGAIICTAFVSEFRELTTADAINALIECRTQRCGLFLTDVQRIEGVPAKGKQGIWYFNPAGGQR